MGNAVHKFPTVKAKHLAVLHQDFFALVRHLMTHRPQRQFEAAQLVIERAAAGNYHRATTGKIDPKLGNGTLSSALSWHPKAPERRLDDREQLQAIITAAEALLEEHDA